MEEVSLEMIVPAVVVACLVFLVGIFIGRRAGSDRKRVAELEAELNEARKDLDVYRTKVNSHFMKTSELFGRMTDSYKAVYLHLAEASQDLCTSDVALLTSNSDFLKGAREEEEQVPEVEASEQQKLTGEPTLEPAEQPDREPDAASVQAAEGKGEEQKQMAAREEPAAAGGGVEEQGEKKTGESRESSGRTET
jgi:uncharacterized membrane-anchored protein YhcB (DUF1043 family)